LRPQTRQQPIQQIGAIMYRNDRRHRGVVDHKSKL
jgi:hypothetical protein